MTMLDETTLLAYVDGRLTSEETRRIEAALAHDAEAREIVAKLRQTPDVRAVFDRALDQPLPPSIAAGILRRPIGRKVWPRIALAPAAVAALALFAIGLWLGTWLEPRTATAAEPWVQAVAEYQALYGRATVNQQDTNGDAQRETSARLAQAFDRAVAIPDWRAQGLAFKRGQILEFDGRPLVQLVYLPRQGKPIAYCLLASDASDLAPTSGQTKGMRYVHWRSNGVAHLVIGDAPAAELDQLVALARRS